MLKDLRAECPVFAFQDRLGRSTDAPAVQHEIVPGAIRMALAAADTGLRLITAVRGPHLVVVPEGSDKFLQRHHRRRVVSQDFIDSIDS